MPDFTLKFELADGAVPEETAALIEQRLGALDMVDKAEAPLPDTRLGVAEAVLAIQATILIAKNSAELLDALRRLVPAIKGFIKDVRGVKNIYVKVGKERIPISELTDEQLQKLAVQK